MKEIINKYKSDIYLSHYPYLEFDFQLSKIFLDKYYTFENIERKMGEVIFTKNQIGNPIEDLKFNLLHELILYSGTGGMVFSRDKFDGLKKLFFKTGSNYFYVFNHPTSYPDFDLITNKNFVSDLKFKFPIAIKWDELCSGNIFSSILTNYFPLEFYVFDENFKFGFYASNEIFSNNFYIFSRNFKFDFENSPFYLTKNDFDKMYNQNFIDINEGYNRFTKYLPSELKNYF